MKSKIPERNCILIDWFSFTSRNDTVQSMISRLGLSEYVFTLTPGGAGGKYGFRSTYSFSHINIYCDHWKEKDLIMVDMSGQGCRAFDEYSKYTYTYLFGLCLWHPNYNVTRIDLAHDDHEGLLDIRKILKETVKRNYVSKTRKNYKYAHFNGRFEELSVMYGSKSSDIYIRIYDKAAERGYDQIEKKWVRTEIVLKQSRAEEFLRLYLSGSEVVPDPKHPEKVPEIKRNLGELFYGILNNYLRFVVPDPDQKNVSRFQIRKWWKEFIGSIEKIRVYVKKNTDYNLHKLQRYIVDQAGNSIETLLLCVGEGDFWDRILSRESKLKDRQKKLIQEYQLSKQSIVKPLGA
ncbi:MAG: replication initiation factor domain-containing protein [Ruminococcaceae bacterium]|nr:replication initiation factor domain-containing protein [Oscillospiraceae bacterium]